MQTSLAKQCAAEFIGTFALIFVGIGAMNLARWFGPALVANNWKDAIVYFAGLLLGGRLAGLIYGRFLIKP